jgi:hypothetical protein
MRLTASLLVLASLVLSGCESVSERFSAVPPKIQVFAGDQDTVKAAALQAFRQLDFRVTRAKGFDLEAVSRIHSSAAFADSRQLLVKLQLTEAGPGKTAVEMTITEQFQSDRVGGTAQQSMREHGFFQLYFATLQQFLDVPAAPPEQRKN